MGLLICKDIIVSLFIQLMENIFDMNRFAGEGNIGHMVEQVRQYGTKHGDMEVL